ncbi:response regulator [Sphingobium sp. DEHP117]|uniref:response regulator n=1 Tax=Sphingobium sp. DEHP117 TaxID=2993436 RepID=UPI0027D6F402|nr:response regulator [Sphingobium sp. DEHP117]MDQ4421848.1 response regulator [Sphingobium sp. DEHP117]
MTTETNGLSLSHALLVEDSMLIAMNAEDALLAIGIEQVSIASSVAEAFDLLKNNSFDVALLDLHLEGETSLPIAETLLTLGIPFVFASGYPNQEGLDPKFSGIPFLQKPYNQIQIRDALLSIS